jgi:hypothetical protein
MNYDLDSSDRFGNRFTIGDLCKPVLELTRVEDDRRITGSRDDCPNVSAMLEQKRHEARPDKATGARYQDGASAHPVTDG